MSDKGVGVAVPVTPNVYIRNWTRQTIEADGTVRTAVEQVTLVASPDGEVADLQEALQGQTRLLEDIRRAMYAMLDITLQANNSHDSVASVLAAVE